jgi:tRNA(Ile)-lysidine synthase
VRALARAAAIARDDAQFLEEVTAAASARIVVESEDEVRLDAAQLRRQPLAIRRRVVAHAISRLAGGRFVAFEHAERLLDLVDDASGASRYLYLPGQVATCSRDMAVLRRNEDAVGADPSGTNFRFSLSIPGEVLSPAGWVLSAARLSWPPGSGNGSGALRGSFPVVFPGAGECGADARSCAVLDAAVIQGPLVVRNWVRGDRFRPLGMTGTRKLQDLFVDRKVQRSQRSQVPIVVDAADRIVWVAGHLMAEDFRVTPATSDVVILKLKYWSSGT